MQWFNTKQFIGRTFQMEERHLRMDVMKRQIREPRHNKKNSHTCLISVFKLEKSFGNARTNTIRDDIPYLSCAHTRAHTHDDRNRFLLVISFGVN